MPVSLPSAAAGIQFTVLAQPCPQVLSRILGLFARQWIIPRTVHARCDEDAMLIAIMIEPDALGDAGVEILLGKIAATVMVREANLVLGDLPAPR